MRDREMQNEEDKQLGDKIYTVKKILKGNRARALGVATMFSLSSILGACSTKNEQAYVTPDGHFEEQESTTDASGNGTYHASSYHQYHGGSYYYYKGASDSLSGSWGKNNTNFKSVNAGETFYSSKSALKSSGGKSGLTSGKSSGIGKSSYKGSSGSSGKSGGVSG
jgi:hypothetical protein